MAIFVKHYLMNCHSRNDDVRSIGRYRVATLRCVNAQFDSRRGNVVDAVSGWLPRRLYAVKQALGLGR